MTCVNLRFGANNHVEDAVLTATPTPVTDLEWLKGEWRAEQVVWNPVTEDIVIEGIMPDDRLAEYFALPTSNLTGYAQVKLELFSSTGSTTDVLEMDFQDVGSPKPLGIWRAGIDPYGVLEDPARQSVFVYWLPNYVRYRKFRLTIRHSAAGVAAIDDVRLRMLMIGEKLELQKNFSYGNEISFHTGPELIQTSSGSHIPSRRQRMSRKLSLSLDHMGDRDRIAMYRFEASLDSRAFIVSAYGEQRQWQFENYSFLARFNSELSYQHVQYDRHATKMTLVEI